METHLITSENSDNDTSVCNKSDETSKTNEPTKKDEDFTDLQHAPSDEFLPSTSAQAGELTQIIDEGPPRGKAASAKNIALDKTAETGDDSSPKVKSKKGTILCMNRLNSILLHFAVPLSLLICKDLFVFYLN